VTGSSKTQRLPALLYSRLHQPNDDHLFGALGPSELSFSDRKRGCSDRRTVHRRRWSRDRDRREISWCSARTSRRGGNSSRPRKYTYTPRTHSAPRLSRKRGRGFFRVVAKADRSATRTHDAR